MIHISPVELQERMRQEDIFLLDVREASEHESFNIGGELIPLDSIIQQSGSIPKDRPVIVYCKLGIRSQIAIQRLEDRFGFSNLVNLKGGMEAWKRDTLK